MNRMNERDLRIRLMAVVTALAIVCSVTVFLLTPSAPVKDVSKIEYVQVYRIVTGSLSVELEDITGQLDTEVIKNILPLVRRSRLSSARPEPVMNDRLFEIYIVYDHKPLQLILCSEGDSYAYSSFGGGLKRLMAPESWIALLRSLSKEAEQT